MPSLFIYLRPCPSIFPPLLSWCVLYGVLWDNSQGRKWSPHVFPHHKIFRLLEGSWSLLVWRDIAVEFFKRCLVGVWKTASKAPSGCPSREKNSQWPLKWSSSLVSTDVSGTFKHLDCFFWTSMHLFICINRRSQITISSPFIVYLCKLSFCPSLTFVCFLMKGL